MCLLDSREYVTPGTHCVTAGWGLTVYGGLLGSLLLPDLIKLPIYANPSSVCVYCNSCCHGDRVVELVGGRVTREDDNHQLLGLSTAVQGAQRAGWWRQQL